MRGLTKDIGGYGTINAGDKGYHVSPKLPSTFGQQCRVRDNYVVCQSIRYYSSHLMISIGIPSSEMKS